MPNRNYPSAYLRYLQARLWNLSRPGFWGTAIFLLAVGLVIREYWFNPDFLMEYQNYAVSTQQSADSSLSDEDQMIAADIDNLPVLLNESEKARLSALVNIPQQNSANPKSKSLFPDVTSKQKSTAGDNKSNPVLGLLNGVATPKEQNPFVVQANNLLQIGTSYGNNSLLGVKSSTVLTEQTTVGAIGSSPTMGLPTQTDNSQNAVVISPLQAAINQTTNQNLANFNGVSASQTNIMGSAAAKSVTVTPPINGLGNSTLPPSTEFNPATGYNQPMVRNLPQNSLTNFNNSQPLPTIAPVAPVAPVAPSVTSAAPNNIPAYSVQSTNQTVVTPINPPGYENYGNYTVQQPTQVPESNISRPRPTAGLYGGIEINGYRYP